MFRFGRRSAFQSKSNTLSSDVLICEWPGDISPGCFFHSISERGVHLGLTDVFILLPHFEAP
jgi:hypothetical protein